jgi:pantetheine-phosphate adenylyltransferase
MIAIYPGTFDPVTRSHAEIIRRAVNIFPQLIVGVAADTAKNTLLTIEDRVEMVQQEVNLMQLKGVIVMPFYGLLVNFAASNGIKVIVRGLRALSDFEYEFKMSYMNHKLNNNLDTIFIPATEKENFISSSFVKEIARLGGDISQLVSPQVEKRLKTLFKT